MMWFAYRGILGMILLAVGLVVEVAVLGRDNIQ